MTDRGLHPDLIEEETATAEAPATPSPSPRGRRGRASSPPVAATPESESEPTAPAANPGPAPTDEPASQPTPEEPAASDATEPPEWWQQVRDAADPKAALALLAKNLPKDELEKDPTLQGWIGDMGNRRARAMIEQAQKDDLERQKRDAATRGDYYGLGQLTAPELAQQLEQAQQSQQFAPFMDAVARYQAQFPEEVQREVQGRTYGAGKSQQEGFVEYLQALTEASVSHRLNEAVEKEIQRREPALRKAWLSQSNGAQPVPELDGGAAPGVREITDEQLARMSLAESDAYLDDRGQPRPGVRLRLTRAINLREQQR